MTPLWLLAALIAHVALPIAATACQTGQFQCAQGNATATATAAASQILCISDEHLCDDRLHCPLGDDENLEMCKRRACGPGQFQCQSPGHCIAASRRCDGVPDCRRAGLDDQSDEHNCVVNKPLTVSACATEQFACRNGHGCVDKMYVCDGFSDCDDNSDEAKCPLQCRPNEFKCDNRCMKESLRCDGRMDCLDGRDEKDCRFNQCSFASEFRCRHGNKCVSKIFVCDTTDDCESGDDEVCPISHQVCKDKLYWTCKSGTHCILAANRCDAKPHCPDGSDEVDCPTTVPPPAPVICPPAHHLCNASRTCVDIAAACAGRARCPQPDTELERGCRAMLSARSPCATDNGGCDQLCKTSLEGATVVASCGCRPGYQVSPDDPRRCVDVDECQQFGSCAQLCANTPGSFACSCLPGYRAHGPACLAHGAAKLLFSTDSTIEFLDLDTGARSPVLRGLHYPKYLASDHAARRVFYHDRDGSLASVGIDGSDHRVLLRGLTVDAIAYDWTRRLLFYSAPRIDGVSGHVGVVNVSSGLRAVLRVLDCPRGLALHPARFALYVTLWCGPQPGVYAMRMDGADFRLLADAGGLPGHLAIDLAQAPERLYWTDARHRGVFSGTADGGRDLRAHLHQILPFDLALFQDRLYYTDMHLGKLYATSKFATNAPIETKLSAHSVLSVTAFHSLLQPPRPDAQAVADCSACQHICLAPPAGSAATVCLCDASYRLEPGTGRCVNGSRPGDARGAAPPAPTESAAARPLEEETGSPLDGRVGSIAGIVIGTLCVCLIFGVALAMYCLRMQDKHALSVNLSGEVPHSKMAAGSVMPKVNSRTPLTECEIDMDNKF